MGYFPTRIRVSPYLLTIPLATAIFWANPAQAVTIIQPNDQSLSYYNETRWTQFLGGLHNWETATGSRIAVTFLIEATGGTLSSEIFSTYLGDPPQRVGQVCATGLSGETAELAEGKQFLTIGATISSWQDFLAQSLQNCAQYGAQSLEDIQLAFSLTSQHPIRFWGDPAGWSCPVYACWLNVYVSHLGRWEGDPNVRSAYFVATDMAGTSLRILQPPPDYIYHTTSDVPYEYHMTSDFDDWWVRTTIWRQGREGLEDPVYNVRSQAFEAGEIYYFTTAPLPNGDWTLMASMYSIYEGQIRRHTARKVNFSVSVPDNPYGLVWTPPPTSTSTEIVLTCDKHDGAFARSLCYLFTYLFTPSAASVSNLYAIKDEIVKKPPIGYITKTFEALRYDETATPSWAVASASSFFEGLPIIKTSTGVLIIVGFLAFLFRRVRDLDL